MLAEWRARRDAESHLTHAWQAAALVAAAMVGKLPKLEKLIEQMMQTPPQAHSSQPQRHTLSLKDIGAIVGVRPQPASPEAIAALERQAKRLRG